ncbi:MAG: hypothetical protein GX799_00020 [Crenarchaeota archaeon]|nr:hypothetical protein [Thermoproteota archaeon]
MSKIGKTFALLLTLTVAMSCLTLLTVKPTNAQTIPKPSIPEFTLQFVDNSYEVPPIFSTNPYTGESIITQDGYHVENKSIAITIKNQPFNNYRDSHGNNIMMYYDIRWKGYFEDKWRAFSSGNNYIVASSSLMESDSLVYPNAPSTLLPYSLGENHDGNTPLLGDITPGGQVDFQVQAFIGYYITIQGIPDPLFHRTSEQYVFVGESSSWSNTQTITIGEPTNSNTPNPTLPITSLNPTTTQMPIVPPIAPDTNSDSANLITLPLEAFVIIVVVVGALAVVLSALLFRRHRKTINLTK